jgi:spore coat protein U-like protein
MQRFVSLAAIALAGCAAFTVPAFAASPGDSLASGSMGVSLEVDPGCTIEVTDLSFGSIASASSAKNESTTGDIKVTCTDNAKYEIGLGAGANPATPNDTTTRQLKNANTAAAHPTLTYDLFSDSGRNTHWGDTDSSRGTPDTVSDVGNGAPQDHTVYGTVTGSQSVSVGSYNDTVAVTVWYEGEKNPT